MPVTILKSLMIGVFTVSCVLSMTACQSVTPSTNHSLNKGEPNKIVQARLALAQQYYTAGDLDRAKQQVDLALSIAPNHAQATMLLAMILAKEGSPANLSLAEQYFKQAIKSDGGNALIAFEYAMYLVQMGRLSDAVSWFEKAGSTLGFDGRVLALENLAYVRVQQWQNQPNAITLQSAKQAVIRAINAGSKNANLIQQAERLSSISH